MTSANVQAAFNFLRKEGFMSDERPEPILFLDDHRGIYIPRDFAQSVKRECVSGIEASDLDFLINEMDADHYWDVWSEVCDRAIVTDDKGNRFTLYQDGALWLIPEGMDFDERTDSWFWSQPMRVTLSPSDDDGSVTVYCEDQRQARLDRSIDGSNWECPRDMDVAYASITDRPTLVDELRAEGYDVDDSEYSPPDAEDLAYWSYKTECECSGTRALDRAEWLALQIVEAK